MAAEEAKVGSNNKLRRTGLVIACVFGGVSFGLVAVSVPFVLPALRKYCLPYVPATPIQTRTILRHIQGRPGKVVDLGSGDGRVCIAAAKQGNYAVGYELNPWLVWYSKWSALVSGTRRSTEFHRKDLWKCSSSNIRLVNGTSYREGRVEVCVGGRWGTVCGEGWTNEMAGQVCSGLGFSSTGGIVHSFNGGTDSQLIYNVGCLDETCQRILTVKSSACTNHSQDVGVSCQSYREACDAEINETLSSLTTPPPVECPTMDSTQCQCSPPPPTNSNNTLPNEGSSQSTVLGLICGMVILLVLLLLALIGWVITCVNIRIKESKTKGHTHPLSPSDTAYELNNPVYETGKTNDTNSISSQNAEEQATP